MGWLLEKLSLLDPEISPEKILRLQFQVTNSEDELVATWLTAEALQYSWASRQSRRPIQIHNM